jgi:ribosome maturation factor RimP
LFLEARKGASSLVNKIESLLEPRVQALGYELLELEYQPKGSDGTPVLRLFVENTSGAPVSLEDCVTVDHGLDPVIESPEFDALLPKGFALEVSSPGVDRPLRKPADFAKFSGTRAQIHTFRPLTADELSNAKYFETHQKQKNFFGVLQGIEEGAVTLNVDNTRITIPFALISKANLDVARSIATEDKQQKK